MRRFFTVFLMIIFISPAFAKGHSSKSYSGKTHNVRPYVRKNGSFVKPHRAGNPKSGAHCKDNVCY